LATSFSDPFHDAVLSVVTSKVTFYYENRQETAASY